MLAVGLWKSTVFRLKLIHWPIDRKIATGGVYPDMTKLAAGRVDG